MRTVGGRKVALAATLCALSLWVAFSSASAVAAIYWESPAGIGRANIDGTNPQLDFIPSLSPPKGFSGCGGVAVDEEHVYWASPQRGAVGRAAIDGSDPNYDFIPTDPLTCGVAVNRSNVFWTSRGNSAIGRAGLDGTGVDQEFIPGLSRPCDVEADEGHLLWDSGDSGWIGRADLDGGGLEPEFIEGAGRGCGIAVSGGHVYWANSEKGAIARANLDGGEIDREFITGLDQPCGIAIHGGFVYWAEEEIGESGAIGRADLNRGDVNRSLVTGLSSPCGITVDDRLVPPPPPPPPPPPVVSFGRVKHGARNPVTFISLLMPQAGSIKPLVGLPRVGWKLLGSRDLPGAGKRWLKLVPKGPKAAKQKFLRLLDREGRITVPLRIEFTGGGYTTFTPRKTVLLLKPSPARR